MVTLFGKKMSHWDHFPVFKSRENVLQFSVKAKTPNRVYSSCLRFWVVVELRYDLVTFRSSELKLYVAHVKR